MLYFYEFSLKKSLTYKGMADFWFLDKGVLSSKKLLHSINLAVYFSRLIKGSLVMFSCKWTMISKIKNLQLSGCWPTGLSMTNSPSNISITCLNDD